MLLENGKVRIIDPRDIEWTKFQHPRLPGGDMTPWVAQIDDYTMLAHFMPGFVADAHSHPGGGTYYIIHGSMDFGDGIPVHQGMIRTVAENHPYGPERADPVLGVTFLLSSRKPIDIDFIDPEVTIDQRPACI